MAAARFIPKRIILSRKGWDSKAGGKPSPVLQDGTPLSLPIPDGESGVCYNDLRFPDGSPGIGALVENLTAGRVRRDTEVHLDPDLRKSSIEREKFKSAFGQCGQAQFHLRKQGLCKDTNEPNSDLFLFFGLFRPALKKDGVWKYDRHPAIHLIFGWLQVDSIYNLPGDQVPEHLLAHPHALPSAIVRGELGRFKQKSNTLYLGRECLTFQKKIAGAGVFRNFDYEKSDDRRRLTKPGSKNASEWQLPSFCCSLSNMGLQKAAGSEWWEPQRRGYGQEFVLHTSGHEAAVTNWLEQIFTHAGSEGA